MPDKWIEGIYETEQLHGEIGCRVYNENRVHKLKFGAIIIYIPPELVPLREHVCPPAVILLSNRAARALANHDVDIISYARRTKI